MGRANGLLVFPIADNGQLAYLDFAQRIAAETVGEHVDEKARLLQRQGDSRAG